MGARIRGTHLKGHELQSAISQTLNTFREEINEVRAEAIAAEIPKALWKPPIEQALELTAPTNLTAPWNANRDKHLRAEVVVSWDWLAWASPAEEDAITEEELAAIEAELSELETAASAEGVPAALRNFILKQVKAIRTALAQYHIKGVAPLKAVVSQTVGDAITASQTLKDVDTTGSESKAAMAKLGSVWKRIASATKDATVMYQVYEIGAEKLPQLLSVLKEFL